jgi:hypothetical protein
LTAQRVQRPSSKSENQSSKAGRCEIMPILSQK